MGNAKSATSTEKGKDITRKSMKNREMSLSSITEQAATAICISSARRNPQRWRRKKEKKPLRPRREKKGGKASSNDSWGPPLRPTASAKKEKEKKMREARMKEGHPRKGEER